MVILSGTRPKRTPTQRIIRFLIGVTAIACIIFSLSLVPYDILRAERFRLFGETMTTGIVTSVSTKAGTEDGSRFFIEYKYVDSDGLARHASARLPQQDWQRLRPGTRIEVLFARQRPGLSRVRHEIEPPFQQWLRRMLH
jgi:hypothetical protein